MPELEILDKPSATQGWYSNEAATFGDRVAAGREALGMNQQDLSDRLGVKLKTIQAWENDLSEPRANKLQMLSGVLNVSLMWLLNGEGDGIDSPDEALMSTPEVTEILTEIRALKSSLSQTADKLGALEKRLRKSLKDQA